MLNDAPCPPHGNGTQAALAEIEAQWAQTGGAAETKSHGDQWFFTQKEPELNQPSGQELPVFWMASRSLLGLLRQ